MNLLIGIAALSITLNILCFRELKKKQRNKKNLTKQHRRAINALDVRESQVRNLIHEIWDLEKGVN